LPFEDELLDKSSLLAELDNVLLFEDELLDKSPLLAELDNVLLFEDELLDKEPFFSELDKLSMLKSFSTSPQDTNNAAEAKTKNEKRQIAFIVGNIEKISKFLTMKIKFLLLFSLGFILATGISIYKQEKVASKANKQISIANTVISDLQNKQRELENLKKIYNEERFYAQQERNNLRQEIERLRYRNEELEAQPGSKPVTVCESCEKIPDSFRFNLGRRNYLCKMQ